MREDSIDIKEQKEMKERIMKFFNEPSKFAVWTTVMIAALIGAFLIGRLTQSASPAKAASPPAVQQVAAAPVIGVAPKPAPPVFPGMAIPANAEKGLVVGSTTNNQVLVSANRKYYVGFAATPLTIGTPVLIAEFRVTAWNVPLLKTMGFDLSQYQGTTVQVIFPLPAPLPSPAVPVAVPTMQTIPPGTKLPVGPKKQ